ncbi:MAG: phosphate acyltransferase PlsX [Firmicutes bacterium]|jgi:glycerol-3-phosphate acyltransferase PlsX|nr:phosphate acyltransferase PlsX [Bacillota bacterium]
MKSLAIDCMGGDHAPAEIVKGAIAGAKEFDLSLILVGDQSSIEKELAALPTAGLDIDIVHTTQIIEPDDSPAMAVRRKRDSSMVVAHRLVKEGRAKAVFSAGNTGAIVACGLFVLGRLEKVERPALAPLLPTLSDQPLLLLDAGANTEAKPEHLLQYAQMAHVYLHRGLKRENPRIALLNIGVEAEKGTPLHQEAYQLLKDSGLNFLGNIEARDILNGDIDVLVADGFTGNIALKLAEGLAGTFGQMIKEELTQDFRGTIGGLLSKPALTRFKLRLDYSEHGAAPLLGVNGICLKGHGSSKARAIYSALRVAQGFVNSDLIEEIKNNL